MDLSKIYKIGIKEESPALLQVEVIIVNLIALFGVFLGLFYSTFFTSNNELLLSIPYFICFVSYLFVLILNYYQQYFIAKNITIIVGSLICGVSIIYFGKDAQSQIFIGLLMGFAVILMKNKALILSYIVGIFTVYIYAFYRVNNNGAMYDSYRFAYDDYFNFGGAMLAFTGFSLLIFHFINRNFDKLNELNDSLKNRNEELKNKTSIIQNQKNELIAFSDMASHDLKTPSRNIKSYLGLLKKSLESGDNEKTQTYLNFAIQGSDQLINLINGITNFKTLDEEIGTVAKFSLNKLVQKLKEEYDPKFSHISLEDLPNIIADREHFLILFRNLFNNSLQFNSNEKKEISVSHQQKEESFIIEIQDNGIGIEESYHELIFEPFKKLNPNHIYDTTGLGLALCKKITQIYNGNIKVKSSTDEGTVIQLNFPNQLIHN